MAASKYHTKPLLSSRMPSGIPFIVGNEAAERFSYYGMRAILLVFMTEYLMNARGSLATMSPTRATEVIHLFVSATYGFGIVGALISDALLGKYRTIILGSILYCLGHVALALMEPIPGLPLGNPEHWLFGGLFLIALGAGGIKPCVSAHVGDQFGSQNKHLISKVFSWFYFSINFGSTLSTLLTPLLLAYFGSHVAFGVPGVLMFLATVVFWLGRYRFVHVPAGGIESIKEGVSTEGFLALANLSVIYLFVAVFWSLFDQTTSSWVEQAKHMNRVTFGYEWLPSQIQAVNPVLILIFIPLFSYVVYPLLNRIFAVTPLRKMAIGLFLPAGAFAITAWVEEQITAGDSPSILWQFFAYAVMTASEVLVSITCLEFSYTQAPRKMKSFIMAIFLMSVALGNLFTALVNTYKEKYEGHSGLEGAAYFWFFTYLMLAAACLFLLVVKFYRGRTYIQDDDS